MALGGVLRSTLHSGRGVFVARAVRQYPQVADAGVTVYFAVLLAIRVPWADVARSTLLPRWSQSGDLWLMVVAILGTTISPYLFFWQAAQEVEDTKADAQRVPLKQKPVQAPAVLAAYALGEARRWPVGLSRKPLQAKAFYATIAAATLLGAALNAAAVSPMKALVWAAGVNGVVASPVMALLMLMAADARVMGRFKVSGRRLGLGWLATVVMIVATGGWALSIMWKLTLH